MATAKKHKHEKLGLDFKTYGALLATRELLKRGDLVHTPHIIFDDDIEGASHCFNMGVDCRVNDQCGSASCVGGTMALIMGLSKNDARAFVHGQQLDKGPLRQLFFPPDSYNYNSISVAQSVKAIDNFLDCGKPKWATFLRKNQKTS